MKSNKNAENTRQKCRRTVSDFIRGYRYNNCGVTLCDFWLWKKRTVRLCRYDDRYFGHFLCMFSFNNPYNIIIIIFFTKVRNNTVKVLHLTNRFNTLRTIALRNACVT